MENMTDRKSHENWFYILSQVFIRPYSAGAKLVEEKKIGPSILAVVLHVLSSGAFFYLLVSKTEGLIQQLITWLSGETGSLLRSLSETTVNFLHDTVVSWIGTIPVIGEKFQEPAQTFADKGIISLSGSLQTLIDQFYQDLSDALRLPSLLCAGLSVLIVIVVIMLLVLFVWAMLNITKHKWRGFKHAFCLSAVRSTVTIPFAIVSALLVLIHPLLGIGLFAFAIFWSLGHLYTTIMAGADTTSGNRAAAWFPPIVILMYLLTAAVMIAVIVVVGVTVYNQLADMVEVYINAIKAAFAG